MIEYKLSLLRVEGLPPLDCLVFSNDCLLKCVSFCVSQPESILVFRSEVKLLLIDESSSIVANVLFDSSLINSPGAHWLPLFFSSFILKNIPEKVNTPRILLEVHPNISPPLIEISESSETTEEAIEDLLSNDRNPSEISIKLLELEQENALIRRKCFLFEKENERLKGKVENLEREKRRDFEKIERYEKLYEEVKLREDSILMLLENKDQELMKMSREAVVRRFDIKQQMFVEVRVRQPSSNKNENEKTDFSRFLGLEAIDKTVQNALKGSKFEGIFNIHNEVIYSIHEIKVSVFQKDELLYVKSENRGVKTLDLFVSQDLVKLFKQRFIKAESASKAETSSNLQSLISKSIEIQIKKKIFNKVLSPPSYNKSSTQKIKQVVNTKFI